MGFRTCSCRLAPECLEMVLDEKAGLDCHVSKFLGQEHELAFFIDELCKAIENGNTDEARQFDAVNSLVLVVAILIACTS